MMHCCRNFSELIDVALVYASFIAVHAIFTGILKKIIKNCISDSTSKHLLEVLE